MASFLLIVQSTFTLKILLLILAGSLFGMIVGAIPGLNTTLAVAIAIPITFYLEPVEALALLSAVYKNGIYGGSVSAVLLGVPGTLLLHVLFATAMRWQRKAKPRKPWMLLCMHRFSPM